MKRSRLIAGTLVVMTTAACSSAQPVAQPAPPARAGEHEQRPILGLRAPVLPAPSASPTPGAAPPPVRVKAQAASPVALTAFGSCDALLTRMKKEALRQVTPWGLNNGVGVAAPTPAVAAEGSAGTPAAASAGGQTFSGTNNQEPGVDEADLVKTDGRLLLTVRQQPLGIQVVDVYGSDPQLRGFSRLPEDMYGARLLLTGGRAVVVGPAMPREQDGYAPRTRVLVLSLADPDEPKVERTFEAEGWVTTAREVAGRVLLVLQSQPQATWAQPADHTKEAERRALEENRRRVSRSTLDTWLPSVTSSRGRTSRADCASTMHTRHESGTSMTSLLSLDPASDAAGAQVSVAGSG